MEACIVRKLSPTPFLLKTYMVVEDPVTDDVISWNAEGTGFVVWQPAEFSRDILPTLFKHSNFSSFVRQLNTYGFRKVATTRWEFCNEKFRKGEREVLNGIRRRKVQHRVIQGMKETEEDQRSSSSTSSSSSSTYVTLVDENKRLKQENGVLSSELKSMRSKCKELLDLVAKYDKLENEKEDDGPKLFGVRLEIEDKRDNKRKTPEISESASILFSQSCK